LNVTYWNCLSFVCQWYNSVWMYGEWRGRGDRLS